MKRTDDVTYGADYWNTLDGGNGYQDSTMWEDIAHTIKEVFGIMDGQDITPTLSALDMGCASGYLVKHLRRRGFDAWGTDFSQYALDHADEDVKTYLRNHDLTSPHYGTQWEEGSFGLVTCLETLEHIPEESVPQALDHIYYNVRRGGRVLLTICVAEQPDTDSDPTHVTIRPRSWWEEKLSQQFHTLQSHEDRLRSFWLFSQHKGVFVLEKR